MKTRWWESGERRIHPPLLLNNDELNNEDLINEKVIDGEATDDKVIDEKQSMTRW